MANKQQAAGARPRGEPAVRSRRAYFDCRFGQLHVRTAFPTTGGFDEQVTVFCLHPSAGSSRDFGRFLPVIAADRSVYAPDLPGCGESDPPPPPGPGAQVSGQAVADLAADLRLRQIDVIGLQDGAEAAAELARMRPELVRRLVLVAVPSLRRLPAIAQPCLVIRAGAQALDATLPKSMQLLEAPELAADLFEAAPQTVVRQLAAFLRRD